MHTTAAVLQLQLGMYLSLGWKMAQQYSAATLSIAQTGRLQAKPQHMHTQLRHLSTALHNIAHCITTHHSIVWHSTAYHSTATVGGRMAMLTAPCIVLAIPATLCKALPAKGKKIVGCTLQATDELVSRSPQELPHFSVRIASLAAYIKAHPATVIVDSLDKLQQVCLCSLLPHCPSCPSCLLFACQLPFDCLVTCFSALTSIKVFCRPPLDALSQAQFTVMLLSLHSLLYLMLHVEQCSSIE